ncbi:MAG: hypothetical protein M0R31_07660 [Candidatus Riflebacteria bacterium]|nr:hypothetical protein [Candidatus Riflebacteria bacterium]
MRHAAMLWGNVKRELGKFLTKVFVGGSLTGTGTEADPIELDGDEESPEPNYYYGTDEDGEKGYHELISLKGEDGKDGEDGTSVYTYVAYAGDNAGTGFSLTPTNLLKYRAEIHVTTELTPPTESDFSGATWVKYIGDDGEDGIDGDSSYVYIAYASDDAGTDFTTTFDPALDYIAILATDTEIPSPAVGDFAGLWKKYKGEPGEDASSDVQDLTGKSKYGALYNWYAATDARNIAAEGWHVPTILEIRILADYLGAGGNYVSNLVGGKLKEAGLLYWSSPNTGATNEVGFNSRGADARSHTGPFVGIKESTAYWASDNSYIGYTNKDTASFICGNNNDPKAKGWSVRLLKSSTTLSHGETGTYTGNDGKVYKTICIGTQEWLAENLAETRFRTGERISFHGATYEDKYTNAEWAALTTEAMCWYNDDETNGWEPGTLTETIETIFKNLDGKEHNSLEGLQGGDAEEGEFYHLTAAEKELVEGLSADDKKEWQTFEYRNIDAGTADTFVFDVMADVPFTINSIVLEVDNGTLTGIAVKINGVAVTGLSSVTATTTAARTNATAANVVAAGDKITFEITTGYTGAPTKLIGKLSYTRT